jgi:hypothetical protein
MLRRSVGLLSLLALAEPAFAQDSWWISFQTPSGNIHCLAANDDIMGTFVDCELREMTGPVLMPRPDWCDLDWGHHFGMSEEGEAEMGCAGDTVVNSQGQVLPYGETIRLGRITCESQRTGLTCSNADGHGFVLARAEQGIF